MQVGRPRGFDRDEALDRALRVFWQQGFDGTSLTDLTAAMGINRPSLYATYGDKESLFRLAIERYVEVVACHVQRALEQPTARAVIEQLWRGSIDLARNSENPRGCFLVQGALACSEAAQSVQQALAKQRKRGEQQLRLRFEQAVAEGDLPSDVNVTDLARFVSTVSHGLAVQAAGGAAVTELEAVAALALRAIPAAPSR
jgi:AcrR family transcriptional regulator